MTRNELLAEVGRRLHNTSTTFRDSIISPAFDFVLKDLAQAGVIDALRSTATFTPEVNTRDYSTATLCGLTAPELPLSVENLIVWEWGYDLGRVPRLSDKVFEQMRLVDGELARGKWKGWRLYPNAGTLQVHPPADADAVAGASAEIRFMKPPSLIAGDDEITQIHAEDLETLVYGIQARMAAFDESTVGDVGTVWQAYLAGRRRMWANTVNRGVRDVVPTPY